MGESAASERLAHSADQSSAHAGDLEDYLSKLYLPVGSRILSGDPANRAHLHRKFGDGAHITSIDSRDLLAAIERRFRYAFRDRAVRALADNAPEFSASTVITRGQIFAIAGVMIAAATMLFLVPHRTSVALSEATAGLFLMNAVFRATLFLVGSGYRPRQPKPLTDGELPTYTVLVPLYREANVVSALVGALMALDYPRDRLDIKLIVEADDHQTVRTAREAAALHPCCSVISVPPGTPRTKPRACNYALPFALGEFTVIYDAEDRPEPDQLRKAAAAFRDTPDSIACFQARLNFYNANDGWLTKLFTLDYLLWFGCLLPGLERLNIPMPLGGTSNHFRTAALRSIHAWDPYNVTEDADLGIRLARVGLRVRVLDSTTFEEATSQLGPWMRQRSRWLKGYMQTWLVHMRSPLSLLRQAGVRGFLGVQLFIAGTFLAAILNPLLWGIAICGALLGPSAASVAHVSLVSLLIGNSLFVCLAALGPARQGSGFEFAPYGLAAPIYWLLISAAGIRALYQLCTRPWHWDKTPHGVSKSILASRGEKG